MDRRLDGEEPGAALATIVTYHFVRRSDGAGLLQRLNGMDESAFREQLAYIRGHYTPVGLFDLVAAADGARALPPRPIVLSFDDGYACQYQVVFPLLADAGVAAAFFPVASALLDRSMLDVNKVQCVLAATDTIDSLVEVIDSAIEGEPDLSPPEAYRVKWWKASRWDPAPVTYVKRMLQHALPADVRRRLLDDLFRTRVSADERSIVDELYMTVDQARELYRAGMTIGTHGDRHLRLSTLSRGEQAVEIDGGLRVLDAVGASRGGFAHCYANGDHNDDSVELLRARGCHVAVSTRPDLARIVPNDMLTLPRIDANDLPVRPDAEPNEWTRRATAAESA